MLFFSKLRNSKVWEDCRNGNMKGAKSTHTTEHTAVWLRFGGIENSGADKKNPERKPSMFLTELQGEMAICLFSQVVSGPLHMSQEMSVWPGFEIFHHQGLSDVPVQRPKVMSPSHCQLYSAKENLKDILAPACGPAEATCLDWGGATDSDRECLKSAKSRKCQGDGDQLPAFRQVLRMHTASLRKEKKKSE